MAGYEGAAISADDFLENIGTYWKGATVVSKPTTVPAYTTVPTPSAPAYSPEPDYSVYSFSPSYFAGSTDDFFRSISGAPSVPYVPGISEPPTPLWSMGGDMETMSLEGSIDGGAIGAPRVDESMQANMSRAMLLPDGQPDWGKWLLVLGVIVAVTIIGRELFGQKGSAS